MRQLATLLVLILTFTATVAKADQRDAQLGALFDQLLEFENYSQARPVEADIWRIWTTSEDAAVNTLMSEGLDAMNRQDFPNALRKFDQMVAIAPDFAEAWNKRATLHYLMQNYDASLADIGKTLSLEPRHFGALAGQGLVFGALEQFEEALAAFDRALEIHPNLIGAQRNAAALRKYLKDREI